MRGRFSLPPSPPSTGVRGLGVMGSGSWGARRTPHPRPPPLSTGGEGRDFLHAKGSIMTCNCLPLSLAILLAGLTAATVGAADPWVVYEGGEGPGKGKHVVLVSGDEEYRSEEALPQLAKILARHHGFKCTVLFAIDKDGTINPNEQQHSRPGSAEDGRPDDHLHALPRPARRADEAHRRLRRIGQADHRHAHRDACLQHQRGQDLRQVLMATASKDGGFGRQVLGETWVNHHGQHGKQSTRGILVKGQGRIRSSAASRTATSGARPTSIRQSAAARRLPAAGAGPGAQGHEADRRAASRARRTIR